MFPRVMLPLLLALAAAGCTPYGQPNGTLRIANESGRVVKSAQVNIVDGNSKGQFRETPRSSFDQLNRLGRLEKGEVRIVKYFTTGEFNIDTLVIWDDGRRARFSYGYLEGPWGDDAHTITIKESEILFDGKPPIPAQSDPEGNYGKSFVDPWSPALLK